MALGPLYYAAIGSGVLALLVVLVFLIHIYNRRLRSSSSRPSYTTSPFPNGTPKTTASSSGGGFSGYPPSPPNHNQTRQIGALSDGSASPSPRTGTGGGRLKKVNSDQYRNGRDANTLSPQHRKKPIPVDTAQEEVGEMVMVTYEEGLKKLGIDKPHHILYPDPPTFDVTGATHPYAQARNHSTTPPFSSLSSRPTPTTATLLTPSRDGQGQVYHQYDSPLKKQYSAPSETTPVPVNRTNVGRLEEGGRFPTDSELMTTGIPSYYHDSSAGRYKLESPVRTP